MAGFWRKALPVGRWMTEAYGLAATSTAELQVLVLPGNPGNSNFYSRFVEQLHGLFSGTADVWACSQPGHDALDLSHGQLFSLEEQVQHKVALLREHVLAPGRPPAIIVAHSIGAYMVLHAIKQIEREAAAAGSASPTERLVKVVLLMPFMATDWASTKQRALCVVASCGAARLLAGAATLLALLPVQLQELLVALCHPRAEPHARHGIRLLLGASVLSNFHLAWHEFKDLDRPADWTLIQRLGKRAAVVCAPDDIWFPSLHYREMCEALPGVEEFWDNSLSHDFCLYTSQSERVAQLVKASSAPQLAQLRSQQPPGGLPHLASSEDVSVLLDTNGTDSAAVDKVAARVAAPLAARVAVPA